MRCLVAVCGCGVCMRSSWCAVSRVVRVAACRAAASSPAGCVSWRLVVGVHQFARVCPWVGGTVAGRSEVSGEVSGMRCEVLHVRCEVLSFWYHFCP